MKIYKCRKGLKPWEFRAPKKDFYEVIDPTGGRSRAGRDLVRVVTRLEVLRRKRGLTQKMLGEKIGLIQPVVSGIERGGTCRMDYLVKAARVLQWKGNPEELLDIISPWIQVPQSASRVGEVHSGPDSPVLRSRVRLKSWSDDQLAYWWKDRFSLNPSYRSSSKRSGSSNTSRKEKK